MVFTSNNESDVFLTTNNGERKMSDPTGEICKLKNEIEGLKDLIKRICQHNDTDVADCASCCGNGEGVSPDHICGSCGGTGEGDHIVCLACGATVDGEDFIN